MATNSRTPVIYPTHINLYTQCPERYFHERVERRFKPDTHSPSLAKGIAIHSLLAEVARLYQLGFSRNSGFEGPIVPWDITARAEEALPRSPYPSDASWRTDVDAVCRATKLGCSYLDGEARVLATESTYQFPYLRGQDCPPFILAAKVDLILLRNDAQGRSYLDVVDYKTGSSRRSDPIQELAARIVVKQNSSRYGVGFEYIKNTTLFVSEGIASSTVLDAKECGRRWDQIKMVVRSILAEQEWKPNPTPLCEWCPYATDGCTLAPNANEAETLALWLDGFAS